MISQIAGEVLGSRPLNPEHRRSLYCLSQDVLANGRVPWNAEAASLPGEAA